MVEMYAGRSNRRVCPSSEICLLAQLTDFLDRRRALFGHNPHRFNDLRLEILEGSRGHAGVQDLALEADVEQDCTGRAVIKVSVEVTRHATILTFSWLRESTSKRGVAGCS